MLSSADIVATLSTVEDNDSDDAGDELPAVTIQSSLYNYVVLL